MPRPRGKPIDALQETLFANARAVSVLRREAEDELRRSKQVLERAEAMQHEFLANVSHEIRTPLNAIIGFSEALQAGAFGPVGNPQHAEYIGHILTSGRHLLDLIDDILDMARLEADMLVIEPSTFGLAAWTEESLALVRQQAARGGVDLAVDTAHPADAVFVGDARRLRQVFANLVGNAIKFTPQGRVQVRIEAAGPVRAGEALTGLRVAVADDGIGIAPEDRDRLFTRFSQAGDSYTRRHGGLGLGLAICKRLIEKMGGSIGFESEPEQGTTFWFEVPALETMR